jgi:serine/threonine protein kinase
MAAVNSANNMAAVKPTKEYNNAWNKAHNKTWKDDHNKTRTKYKKYKNRGLQPSRNEKRTHKYYNSTKNRNVVGVSGTKNNINKIVRTLKTLERCPKVMKINDINVNNTGRYTLFTEFKFYGDTLEFIEKIIKRLGIDTIKTDDTFMEHILLELAEAIHCIHSNNMAHLDIKPENFVFDENINGSLIDFENDQLGYVCLYNKDTILTEIYTLPYILYMKANKNDNFYFNGFEQDIYSFTCILFMLIKYITKSSISKYRKIIDTLVKHMDITPEQFLQYQALFLSMPPNKDECIKAIYEKIPISCQSVMNIFNTFWKDYNLSINIEETDFDKKILELLLPSLQFKTSSKVHKQSHYNNVATRNRNVLGTPFAMPSTNPFAMPHAKSFGGRYNRIYQKRKTRKRRHQRKASTHSKKQ